MLCPDFSESPGGDPQNPSWRNIPSAALEQSPDFSLTPVQQLGVSGSPQKSLHHPQTHPSKCLPSEGLNCRGTKETKSSSHQADLSHLVRISPSHQYPHLDFPLIFLPWTLHLRKTNQALDSGLGYLSTFFFHRHLGLEHSNGHEAEQVSRGEHWGRCQENRVEAHGERWRRQSWALSQLYRKDMALVPEAPQTACLGSWVNFPVILHREYIRLGSPYTCTSLYTFLTISECMAHCC